ncbi:MAG: hypothetical protein OHK93_005005 [Ramalina farinacea]|uniref:Uncharacterized protein n=1 Tax=Ramalina farinacea TaxID=258253 RepID=A0AA43U256_9LECA|nr:hypothetical protein [Ramalina farinacea]
MYSKTAAVLLCAGALVVSAKPKDSTCSHDGCEQGEPLLHVSLRVPKLKQTAVLAHSPSPAQQDCSAFLACTVTPPTVTTTSGLWNRDLHARDGLQARKNGWATTCGTSTPGYANACHGSVAYSSACSCIGVTQWTTTAPTPTATVTVTKTPSITTSARSTSSAVGQTTAGSATSSTGRATTTTAGSTPLPTCLSAQPTFYLQAANNAQFDGMYADVTLDPNDDQGDNTYDIIFNSVQSSGTLFTIDALGELVDLTDNSIVAATDDPTTSGGIPVPLLFRATDQLMDDWIVPPTCSIADITSAQPTLACMASLGGTVFQICPAGNVVNEKNPTDGDGVSIGVTLNTDIGCTALTLNVLCVS